MQAYILINTQRNKEEEIYKEISMLKETMDTHIIFGEWDMIIKVNVENSEALGTFILDKIRPIEGITLTSTLIIAR